MGYNIDAQIKDL